MKNVQLDDLVLENIVAKETNSFAIISQERVSKRLARNLLSKYNSTKFLLVIERPGSPEINWEFSIELAIFPQRRNLHIPNYQGKQCKIELAQEKLRTILASIFARIKRLHWLRIDAPMCPFITDTIVNIFQVDLHNINLVQLDRLELLEYKSFIFPHENVGLGDYGPETENGQLIQMFSSLLKELRLETFMPLSTDEIDKFWSAVACCSKLKKLSISPRGHKELFHNKNCLRDCLKVLKIAFFKIDDSYPRYLLNDSQWLAESFGENDKLRHITLISTPGAEQLHVFNGQDFPVVKPILARLNYFKFPYFRDSIYDPVVPKKTDVVGLLQSMSENSCLLVTQSIDYSEFADDSEYDERIVSNISDRVEYLLTFWLSVVIHAARSVQLRLSIYREVDEAMENVLKSIPDRTEFTEVEIQSVTDGALLKYRNVKLIVKKG